MQFDSEYNGRGPDEKEAVETLFDMMSKEFETIYDDE